MHRKRKQNFLKTLVYNCVSKVPVENVVKSVLLVQGGKKVHVCMFCLFLKVSHKSSIISNFNFYINSPSLI